MNGSDERPKPHDGLRTIETSVVIPVLNGAATISEQLEALIKQRFSGRLEIIVADNGSTDGTRDLAARYTGIEPEIRLVDASRQRGVNVARNAGIMAARGEKILFCDADDIVAPGWVSAMSQALDYADGVGGMLEYRKLNPHLQHRSPRSAIFPEGEARVPLGACCGWRRTLLLKLGGYDESWEVGGDDIELALRAASAGARIADAPEAILHKRERASRRQLARQYYKYGRARARLIKVFPGQTERRTLRTALSEWRYLLAKIIRGQADDRAVRRTAHNLGRLAGCIEHRCWAP